MPEDLLKFKKNHRSGIVVFHVGAFGGASKRYTTLFLYLNQKYPSEYFYIVNREMFEHIIKVFPDADLKNIIIVGENKKWIVRKWMSLKKVKQIKTATQTEKQMRINQKVFHDQLQREERFSVFRKFYWHIKHYYRQYLIFKEIDEIRYKYDINSFIGVFSGILPLYFYFKKRVRPAIVFSDMDSWFYEIHPEEKKYWYRKYYSFNYAFKKCDKVDFLSPYIYNGVIETGIQIEEDRVSITPCSFSDYSKCIVGSKEDFAIAFAGRLEKNKNPLLFIQAAGIILRKYPSVKFYLLGDGPLKTEIDRQLIKEGLEDKINFLFHKNPPEIFARTSIFVSLQSTNNYPSQSILEAMACGNVIIATDVGDTRMFVNASNGILIALDVNELVKAIELLIIDKKKTLQMGMNAREYALKNHNIEVHAGYYSELLQNAYEIVNSK